MNVEWSSLANESQPLVAPKAAAGQTELPDIWPLSVSANTCLDMATMAKVVHVRFEPQAVAISLDAIERCRDPRGVLLRLHDTIGRAWAERAPLAIAQALASIAGEVVQ